MTALLLEDVASILGNIDIHVTATTNKAAKVLSEFTKADSTTVHSLLGLRVQNDFSSGKTKLVKNRDSKIISNAFILIDEVSIVDDLLLAAMEESTHNCRFLLVGDKDQLAPVNHKKPPIFSQGYLQCELLEVLRQKKGSKINVLAEQLKDTIHTGVFKPIVADGIDVVQVDGETFKSLVHTNFAEDAPVDRYKIICWKNDTVRAYNDHIRSRHWDIEHYVDGETVVTNQPIMNKTTMVYSTEEFATIVDASAGTELGIAGYWYWLNRGCRVFQANNQEEVKQKLKSLASEAKRGGSWSTYFNAKDFFADLRPVHACTTYKSQGSSYDTVFIDLADIGLCREWEQVARQLYVAVTRAKNKVYLYGELPFHYHDYSHRLL